MPFPQDVSTFTKLSVAADAVSEVVRAGRESYGNSCIHAAIVGRRVLNGIGIHQIEVAPVHIVAVDDREAPHRELGHRLGAARDGSWGRSGPPEIRSDGSYGGHVVLIAQGHLIDAVTYQFETPTNSMQLPPAVMRLSKGRVTMSGYDRFQPRGAGTAAVDYGALAQGIAMYEQTDAWRQQDHPLDRKSVV